MSLNETVYQLAMANSVRWNGHVLRREDGHILRRPSDFEVEGQWKKGGSKRTLMNQVEEDSIMVVFFKINFADHCGLLALIRLLLC